MNQPFVKHVSCVGMVLSIPGGGGEREGPWSGPELSCQAGLLELLLCIKITLLVCE